ncbi:hypothetical protein ACFPPE_08990 [Agromyces tardus]|nr:hypothetical protein [Agromyces tardus]
MKTTNETAVACIAGDAHRGIRSPGDPVGDAVPAHDLRPID